MNNQENEKVYSKKIALYTNILTPYRKFFFDLLNDECRKRNIDFKVFVMAATEPDRQWSYDDYKASYTQLLSGKTLVIKHAYIHFNLHLKEIIKSYDPDIMICSGSYLCPGIWTLALNKRKLGYECAFWSESHIGQKRDNNYIVAFILTILRKMIYEKFDFFFYAGELSYDFVKKYAGSGAKGIFVPNLINEAVFSKSLKDGQLDRKIVREKYKLPLDKRVMFMPARLSRVKGIDEFLTLFTMCKNTENIHIAIAGDGELKNVLEKRIAEENLPVSLLGYLDEKEMVNLYLSSDIFLLPSLSDPNPLSCIEALWCGLPLFISDKVGNYKEVLKEGYNGYVFSYDNLSDALDKLNRLLTADDEWFSNAARCSFEKAHEMYDSKRSVSRIIDELSYIY